MMAVKNKIEEFLTRPLIQRGVYALGLLLWVILMWDVILGNNPHLISTGISFSTQISYSTLVLIPIAILALQIIINNRVLWSFIFGLFTSYILITAILMFKSVFEVTKKTPKPIEWTWANIGFLTLFFTTVILIDVVIYYARPRKKKF